MIIEPTKANVISLKKHSTLNEKWLQECICKDTSLLGLGEIDLITSEKVQSKAGRLDLLLHDEQLNRRYEVELMLGATDPSHIMRCIEYWDIERRRYPAYDHVAVLVAENITKRFLNLISLLSGSIPIIAIQVVALEVEGKVILHFVQVLDMTDLRVDESYEVKGEGGPSATSREYWVDRVPPSILALCDKMLAMVNEESAEELEFRYAKNLIDIVSKTNGRRPMWLVPAKTLVHWGGYVEQPKEWVTRFDEPAGLVAVPKRANKAARVRLTEEDFERHTELLREFVKDSTSPDETE